MRLPLRDSIAQGYGAHELVRLGSYRLWFCTTWYFGYQVAGRGWLVCLIPFVAFGKTA